MKISSDQINETVSTKPKADTAEVDGKSVVEQAFGHKLKYCTNQK